MAWKTIKGLQYYYRSEWRNGRAVTSYCGRGPEAKLAEQADVKRAIERKAGLSAFRARQKVDAELERKLNALLETTRQEVAAHLQSLGYHLHRRQWRKRRGAVMSEVAMASKVADIIEQSKKPDCPLTIKSADFQTMWALALRMGRDKTDVSKPDMQCFEEITAHAQQLAGEKPTPVVMATAWTAATAWVAMRLAEKQEATQTADGKSYVQARYEMLKTERATRRYLSALRILAQIQRLGQPGLRLVAEVTPEGARLGLAVGGQTEMQ